MHSRHQDVSSLLYFTCERLSDWQCTVDIKTCRRCCISRVNDLVTDSDSLHQDVSSSLYFTDVHCLPYRCQITLWLCLLIRWSYGWCSQAEQERMWYKDQSATRRSHVNAAVVDWTQTDRQTDRLRLVEASRGMAVTQVKTDVCCSVESCWFSSWCKMLLCTWCR